MGSIVLLHNTRYKKDMLQKLTFKLLDPSRIYYTVKEKSMYLLKELNRSCLAGIFASDCFKKFYFRQQLYLDHAPNLNQEIVPTL